MNGMYVSDVSTAAARSSSRRRWLLRSGSVALLLGLGWVALFFYHQQQLDREYQAILAEIEQMDPSWQWADLLASRAPVADEDNAAWTVLAIAKRLPGNWPPPLSDGGEETFVQRLARMPPPVQLSAALHQWLIDELEAVESVPNDAQRLLHQRHGRYPLAYSPDFLTTPLTILSDSRRVATLFELEAICQAQEGQPDKALDSCRGILHAGRSVGDEPILLAQIIRAGIILRLLHSLERTLAQGEPTSPALALLQQLLETEDQELPALLLTSLRGERAGWHLWFLASARGEDTLTPMMRGTTGLPLVDEGLDRLDRSSLKQWHIQTLRCLHQLIEIAKMPLAQQQPRLREWDSQMHPPSSGTRMALGRPGLASEMLLSHSHHWSFTVFHQAHALLRCSAVGLAAERYRRDHGRWPATLADLCPSYLVRVPDDPYDGQSVRFRRLADGILIYSIGPDETDDGGNVQRDGASSRQAEMDLGLQLWDPDKRRQPPRE